MTSKEVRLQPEKLKFLQYKDGKEAGVAKYAILKDGIVLMFQENEHYYLYSWTAPGIEQVKQMVEKAKKDKGLNTYITQVVKKNYADKWIPDLVKKVLHP